MDLQLASRIALITGASAGIGVGIARVLAQEGASLVLTARRGDALARLAEEIVQQGGKPPLTIVADVTHPADIARIVQEATAALGPIDILVNNAGGSRPIPPDAADAVWDEAFALNFTAPRRLAEAVLPGMRARRWGRIVNISGSMEPRSLNAASSAKAALHLWAKGLACDVAADGVTINTIPPGRIASEQILNRLHPTEEARRAFIDRNIPAGHFGEPEDIGHLVAFLASPQAGYITGAVIPVDGGMRFSSH
jgi:3-oxoacyl-[acyl-carrier protein] reductase